MQCIFCGSLPSGHLFVPCSYYAADMEESLHKLADLTDAAEFEGFRTPPAAPSEPSQAAPEPFLRHRLRSRLPFWRSVCSSAFVLGIITVGFMLPWAAGGPPPAPWASANHASAFEHADFVDTAVASLVSTGAVLRVYEAPFLVSPLGVVPKAENKLRLILDLRYLNQFLALTKFKYETIKSVPDLCAPGDFLLQSISNPDTTTSTCTRSIGSISDFSGQISITFSPNSPLA